MSFLGTAITTEGLRHYNRASVLAVIREQGASAHTEIANNSGLASGTVSAITGELVEEGVLLKVEQDAPSGRGRPRVQFVPRADFAYFVLIRVAADDIEFSLVDYRGALMDRRHIPRDPTRADVAAFGTDLREALNEFIGRSDLRPNAVKLVSISTKGEMDPSEQTLIWSPVFGDQRVNFDQLLGAPWSGKVKVTNEHCFVAHNVMLRARLADQVPQGGRLAVLALSDSIGLGVASLTENGGIEMSAPPFGHTPHEFQGPMCRCGARGCLESFAGFYGILRTAFDAPKEAVPATFIPQTEIAKLAEDARAGDRNKQFAFRQAGAALGLSVSRLFNILGVMPLTVLGRGSAFFDLMQEAFEEQLQNSFLLRLGHPLELSFSGAQSTPLFESNAYESLRNYDRNQVANKEYLKAQICE